MKKIFLVTTLVLSLFFGSVNFVQAALPMPEGRLSGYAAYGDRVAFFNRNAVYLYDLNTKKSTVIGLNDNKMGFAGLTVLNDGVYWIENTVSPAIHKYSFATGLATTIENFGNFGTLEKSCPVGIFQMLNSNQVYYSLEPVEAISPDSVNQPCTGPGSRVYDLNAHKIIDNKTLFYLSGDESKLAYSNGASVYQTIGTLDGNHVWGVYQGYRPGTVTPSYETQVNYQRVRNSETNTTVATPYAMVNVGDSNYSIPNQTSRLLADPAQGRVIVAKGKGKLGNYLVYNINSNTTYKELGPNFVSNAYDVPGDIKNLAVNNLNVLSDNSAKKELYYYDAVADTTCTVSGPSYNTVFESVVFQDITIGGNLVYRGRVLRYSADSETIKEQLICNAGTAPTQTGKPTIPVKIPPVTVPLSTGVLIKATNNPSVYYYGGDGKRYVFYNEDIFKSWYSNFSGVKSISPAQMATIKIGGNVTYRPGTLVKISSDPAVYAVDKSGVLRALTSETVARDLYGAAWAKQIKIIPDFLFANYLIGDPIGSTGDFNPSEIKAWVKDINTDKNL